jgi:hypothetical protein
VSVIIQNRSARFFPLIEATAMSEPTPKNPDRRGRADEELRCHESGGDKTADD